MSEVQARLRAALVAIAEEDVSALYEEEIEYAIATLDDGIRPEEDAQGTVSGACAAVGRLDLLVEARVLGYPWNAKTCANAAWSGYFRILEYAHERGCPWDEGTCCVCRLEWTFGVFEVRARARVSLGREHVLLCHVKWEHGSHTLPD